MSFSQAAPGREGYTPPVFFPNFERMLDEQARIDEALRKERRAEALRSYTDPDYWLRRSQGIEFRSDALLGIRAAATPATANFTQMAKEIGNAGGAPLVLPNANTSGGRQRTWIDTLTLNSQASGTVFGVARIPLYAVLCCIEVLSSVSLGTATIAFGDAGNANSAIYAAAQTLTAVNTVTRLATSGTKGASITTGFDSVTGLQVTPFNPQTPGQGGLMYEDIIMTTAVASLPASGTLVVMIEYLID